MVRRWGHWDIFRDFEDEFKEIDRMLNRMLEASRESREPLIYGFSMHVGPDGVPQIEHFGNVRPEIPEGTREPFTSTIVDDKANEVRVTAEMPGVGKSDIELNATDSGLTIKVDKGDRKYYKDVALPAAVNPDSAAAKYNNGVLEVTLKLKEKKPKGKTVKIE